MKDARQTYLTYVTETSSVCTACVSLHNHYYWRTVQPDHRLSPAALMKSCYTFLWWIQRDELRDDEMRSQIQLNSVKLVKRNDTKIEFMMLCTHCWKLTQLDGAVWAAKPSPGRMGNYCLRISVKVWICNRFPPYELLQWRHCPIESILAQM